MLFEFRTMLANSVGIVGTLCGYAWACAHFVLAIADSVVLISMTRTGMSRLSGASDELFLKGPCKALPWFWTIIIGIQFCHENETIIKLYSNLDCKSSKMS